MIINIQQALPSIEEAQPIQFHTCYGASIQFICQLNPQTCTLTVCSQEQKEDFIIENLLHYTFVSCPVSLTKKMVILVCCISNHDNQQICNDVYSGPQQSVPAQFELHFYAYNHNIKSWKKVQVDNMSFASDLSKFVKEAGQETHTYQMLIDANQCLLAGTENHFCIYVKSMQSLYIWSVNFINRNETNSFETINVNNIMQLDVFGPSVYSLVMSNTHIIVGKVNCIHIYNWKSFYKKQQRGGSTSDGTMMAGVSSNKSTTSIELNERMGRAIYLPKITKTTTKEAKSSDVTKKLNIKSSSAIAGGQEGSSNLDIIIKLNKQGKRKTYKKGGNTSLGGDEQKEVLPDEIIKTTISQQENEKVIDMQLLSNSKVLLRSNLGNLFALSCLMPFENDLLVQLYSPIRATALPVGNFLNGSNIKNQIATTTGIIDSHSNITHFRVIPEQIEPMDQPGNGLCAIVLSNSTILIGNVKPMFEHIEQQHLQITHHQQSYQQQFPANWIEIPAYMTIHHPEPIQQICFIGFNNLLVCSGKNGLNKLSLYFI
jgi:hypothetical protein